MKIGDATLYLGDCREILPALSSVDAIVTDPPYGIGFVHGAVTKNQKLGQYRTTFGDVQIRGDIEPFEPSFLLNLNVPTILWGANHYSDKLPAMPSWLIWDKRAASGHQNDFADCEIAWSNTKKVARVFRHHWDGMMRASEKQQRFHPTQKPVALMDWCLSQLGQAETILDPFMGCGPVGVSCATGGRKYIGIEIEKTYFDIACKRIEAAYAQGRLFA